MIIKPPIEPIRSKFKAKVLKLIASPFQKQRGLFIRFDEFMAAFDFGCITDNEARLYWQSNIFLTTPETKKPPIELTNDGFKKLVKSAPCKGISPPLRAN